MRTALAAALFLLAIASPALAGENQSHAAGHFAGELDGTKEGMVQPVGQPPAGGGGLGTRTLNTNTPATAVAPVQLPANALRPQTQTNPPAAIIGPNNGPANNESAEGIRRRLQDKTKDAESEDRVGNFEIQDLMQQQNHSETLRSNTQKKLDDANGTSIRKVD